MIFSKSSTVNGFELSLPVAVCSGLANSEIRITFGELITKYGFPLPLPQVMRGFATLQQVLPLEGSQEACNPHQAVYLTDVV